MKENIISIENLSCVLGGKEILKDISLTIVSGEYFSIVGPNGSGKTTLLKSLMRIVKPEKGKIIHGLSELQNNGNVMVFHCGTARSGRDYVTSGGRVLAVTARGDTYKEAIQTVYDAVQTIHFDGMQYRKDIGKKALPSRICTGSGI